MSSELTSRTGFLQDQSSATSGFLAGRILVVDDEPDIVSMLKAVLGDEGHTVFAASSAAAAQKLFQKEMPDVCFLDVWLPDQDGVELLQWIKSSGVDTSVIMMSGHANVETAVRATRLGAEDFIEKPVSLDKVLVSVQNAMKLRILRQENQSLRTRLERRFQLIGKSRALEEIRRTIELVAARNSTVLITGENGTGKENVARAIHERSGRSKKPLVAINCAAIPEELIESELFGYEKGAFTGAASSKRGKFEQASGGTLFLDEIGDMSLKTQSKVLRVLQDQTFERVGGNESVRVDVRILAATNKDLEEEIKKGSFREDLFYRLNVIPIKIPPLRERSEDIVELAKHYLDLYCSENGVPLKKFSGSALQGLLKYNWPGNIRELKNIMERLSIMVKGAEIDLADLPSPMGTLSAVPASDLDECLRCGDFKEARNLFEKVYLKRRLEESQGNVAKTSEKINVERSHLYRKLKQFEIDFSDSKAEEEK